MKRLMLAALGFASSPLAHSREIEGKPVADAAVLVHGIFEDGTKFAKLKKRLEARGIGCITPKLRYQDGTGGLDSLAAHLKEDIDRAFGPDRRIIVIGFSMGGLVARSYLQDFGGASRCASFITISSPHHGTALAWTYPSKGVVQMRKSSEFLTALEESERNLGNIPVVSYRTPTDLMILPYTSSVWDRAENVEIPVIAHPVMLQSNRVITDIERRLVK